MQKSELRRAKIPVLPMNCGKMALLYVKMEVHLLRIKMIQKKHRQKQHRCPLWDVPEVASAVSAEDLPLSMKMAIR